MNELQIKELEVLDEMKELQELQNWDGLEQLTDWKNIKDISDLDSKILYWIQEHLRFDWLNDFFHDFTRLGNHGELWFLIIFVLFIFAQFRKAALTALCSLASTFLLVDLVIKPIVTRVRPYVAIPVLQRLVAAESSFSFPSGHSATSMAVGYVLLRKLPFKLGMPIFLLAMLMGFSRVYVGVHYPSDVVVGAVIGMIVGEICIQIGNYWGRNQKES